MRRRDFLTSMMTATAAIAVTRTAIVQPTPAGAMPTPVHLDMATKGGLFLENTACDAHAKTSNPRVKTFSRAEIVEQVGLASKLEHSKGAGAPPPSGMTSDEQKARILAQLTGTQGGPEYDAMFVTASLQGHHEAYDIHGSYAQSGEDPALRRIAHAALPLIRLHVSQLSRMQAMMGGARG